MAVGSYPVGAYPTGGGVPSEGAVAFKRAARITLAVVPESRAVIVAAENRVLVVEAEK